jgi:DNA-binding HxlR family transcriptional regulator
LLPGISQKVFTTQLRELERDGVLTRKTSGGAPQRVEYTLTEAGEALITVMESMCSWGTKYLGVPPSLPLRKAETTDHQASDH